MPTWGPTAIAADADDGYEQYGSFYGAGSGAFVGSDGNLINAGVRFSGVAVPAGATVTSATLTLQALGYWGPLADFHAKVVGDDVDSAAAWSGTSRPSQITQTAAVLEWDPSAWTSGVDYGLDVTAIVAEIVARSGWVSGNAMRFAVLNDGSVANSYLRFCAREYSTTAAARLTITYSEGGVDPVTIVVLARKAAEKTHLRM